MKRTTESHFVAVCGAEAVRTAGAAQTYPQKLG